MSRSAKVAILFLFALLPIASVHAGGGDLAFTLDCTGFTSQGSTLELDRDNTGALSEAFIISAIDPLAFLRNGLTFKVHVPRNDKVVNFLRLRFYFPPRRQLVI